MSRIADKIRAYVNDPSVSEHYGEWGILRRDQRILIRKLCDTCDMFERTADELLRKQEWISVDERLPELNGNVRTWGELKIQPSVRVLCVCKQKSGKVFVKEGFYELWGSGVVWKIPGSIFSVTHWMPLPTPPKEDKND